MTTIMFVRHAQPAVDADVAPEHWELSEAGANAARRNAFTVPEAARVLSSTERKAIETIARVSGRPAAAVETDPGFGEVRRKEPVDDAFRDRRRAWVAGQPDERHRNWESLDAATDRMSQALARHHSDLMIVGTHGMILTAWLVHVGLVPAGAPAVEFWEHLALPEIVAVTGDAQLTLASLSFAP